MNNVSFIQSVRIIDIFKNRFSLAWLFGPWLLLNNPVWPPTRIETISCFCFSLIAVRYFCCNCSEPCLRASVNERTWTLVFNVNKGFVSSTVVIGEINAQASVNLFPVLFLGNSDFYACIPALSASWIDVLYAVSYRREECTELSSI
jgi:hypothetical protein